MTRIATIDAWQAFDSRGTPTVGCRVMLDDDGQASVVVPSGASVGQFEAHELRDGDPDRFAGRSVERAVANVQGELADAVRGMDARDWRAVDRQLEETDGTEDLSRLGANAVLAISLASCLAGAGASPLHRHLDESSDATGEVELPLPMVNIVSGGAHAAGAVDIQDVLVIPTAATSFAEAIEVAWRVRTATERVARDLGLPTGLVADEGGIGVPLTSNAAAIELVIDGIEAAGLTPGHDAWLALDVAANRMLTDTGEYWLAVEQRSLTSDALADQVAAWCADYPILSVEDGLADDDFTGWRRLTANAPRHVQILGDDLFVTNAERLAEGVTDGRANAILIKPNQAGTLRRAEAAFLAARKAGYRTVLSARSGDTEDNWLSDLGVGWRTGQIKVGSTMRSERTAKWNRLLEIEATTASRLARPFDLPAATG